MSWLKKLLEWLFPFYCLGCAKVQETICHDCVNKINFDYKLNCSYCLNFQEGQGLSCQSCLDKNPQRVDGLWAVINYDQKNLILKALYNLKYNFQKDWSQPLGIILTKLAEKLINSITQKEKNLSNNKLIISFVPMHIKKQQYRGFNQAELLARELNRNWLNKDKLSIEVENLLSRTKYAKAQMTLKAKERRENMIKAFILNPKWCSKKLPEKVILIDDVATTLATLESACSVLKAAGVKKVYGLVLARQTIK